MDAFLAVEVLTQDFIYTGCLVKVVGVLRLRTTFGFSQAHVLKMDPGGLMTRALF